MTNYTHPIHRAHPAASAPQSQEPFPVMEWTAPSVPHHERSPRWYRIGAGAVLLIATYGILTRVWSMTLVALLVGGIYYLIRHAPAVLHTMRLEQDGFLYDGIFTPWRECREFWVIRTPVYNELHIRRNAGSPREIVIQTSDIDPNKIVASVSRVLHFNADRKERLLDVCIRLLKL